MFLLSSAACCCWFWCCLLDDRLSPWWWLFALSRRDSSIAVRCWMLESWLFHSSFVSGGKDRTRRIVSLETELVGATDGSLVRRRTYRILRTRCPFARAQMLRMSSPFRTLRTAPHTSSLASPN